MIDKMSVQQRVILATVISFMFFIGYDYFFVPKNNLKLEQNSTYSTQKSSSQNNKAPEISGVSNSVSQKVATNDTDDEIIASVKAKHFELKIDNLGRIKKFYLNDSKFKDKDGSSLQVLNSNAYSFPLEIRFKDKKLNNEAFATSYSADKDSISLDGKEHTIVLKQQLSSVEVTKSITFNPNGSYRAKISLSSPQEYFITPGSRPNVLADSYTFHGILLEKNDDTLEVIDSGDVDNAEIFNKVSIIASVDRYYTTLFYDFKNKMDAVVTPEGEKNTEVFVKGESELEFGGYIGAKEYKTLENINPKLTNVIEYGFFTLISKPMFKFLNFLHTYLGNWGWAIVIMTITIRLILFPLTYKGMVSMNKLKEIAPKMKELQQKYKGDPQKLNAHVMELYKKHGANPMGGCLPILLQIPIFFAIYRVLLNTIELKGAPWILWIHDLSVADPYYILPIVMGVTMYIQQRITPTSFSDPTQEKIMKFLPLVFTLLFVTFPAGLTLYWSVNNIFSMAQQAFVNRLFAKQKAEKNEKAEKL